MVHPLGIDNTTRISLLRSMKRLRAVEETIAERYGEWQMRCPVHLSTGQEAVSAAAGAVLTKQDYAVSGHRAHTHYLAKGGSLPGMLAEIYGKGTGCSSGKGGSMHLIDESVGFMGSTAIVGGTIPVGVGLGLSLKLQKKPYLSCVFLGDGACEEGVFFESVNFAVLKKLPILFVCENNLYSVYSHLKARQPEGRRIFEMVRGMGLETCWVDGNDVEQSYTVLSKAARSVRDGLGPQFVELATYRWREHCGPNFDNHIGYRTESEYLEWKEKDPLLLYSKALLQAGVVTEGQIKSMDEEIQSEVAEAFKKALQASPPQKEEVFRHLYNEECP